MLDGKRAGYHPPPYINPPWKPGGINTSTVKKLKEKTTSKSSSIPTYSLLKSKNSMKSGIPTRQQSVEKNSTNGTHNTGSATHRGTSNKETK